MTADALLIVDNEVLLVRRKHGPFEGKWCIPGGFVDPDEKVIDAAARELEEETAVKGVFLSQFGTYGDPGRDPRGRIVCVVYWSFPQSRPDSMAGDDAAECAWYRLDQLPEMAFDHAMILEDVRIRLKEKAK